jgi:hypothetical protein
MAKRAREKGWGFTILLKGMSPMTRRLPTGPDLIKVPPPPNSNKLETKPYHMDLWGTFHTQTIAVCKAVQKHLMSMAST